ncbi:hypothetical protein [Halococcoides cellulosivorans]|uniref:Uncharacterized protein n=1 Tax=Halococcoides cellulosivorans TaxID=1679096 RepID=A0A2R4X420_9EURY|nr:hypothetical protein [Halococcoides cellulosivorans]AWB28546.1 hypothetical protein HARCEL1_13075 [Halococcoides cellulosivorans]
METNTTIQWFDDGDERRSVLFAITMATGFLSIVAGVSTVLATPQLLVGGTLFVVGLAVFALATAIASGRVDRYVFTTSPATSTASDAPVDRPAETEAATDHEADEPVSTP